MKQINILSAMGLCLASILFGCSSKDQLTASGNISGAKGETLYLEEVSTGSPIIQDSIQLSEDGEFSFSVDKHNYPTFYQFRLGQTTIPFALDSLENLRLHASAPNIFDSYQIEEGSEYNKQIQQVSRLRSQTDTEIDNALALYNAKKIDQSRARAIVDSLSTTLKEQLTNQFIFADPKSPAAFYALYQHKGQGAYFAVNDPGDYKAFAAVATAFDQFYPQAPYLEYLKGMALEALAIHRRTRPVTNADSTTTPPINIIAYPEINLLDTSGKAQSLRALASQSRVLLSFTAYSGEWSPALVSKLREIKEKNPSLLIYEVSADSDSYYWKNASRNLPWISVHDTSGKSLRQYNINSLPSFYLIDGDNLTRLDNLDRL